MTRLFKPHIALVSTNADLAGAPLHVQALALGLVEDGYRVSAVFGEDGPVRTRLNAAGIETHVVAMRSDYNLISSITSVRELQKVLSKWRPDIIHAHSAKAGIVARAVGRRMWIPVVYTVHGWGFGTGRGRLRSMLVRTMERVSVGATAHFIAVSEADARMGLDRLRIRPDRITVVPNSLPDVAMHRARPEASNIVAMVARNDHPKDYLTFINACRDLPCSIWCIGKGTDTPDFDAIAREARIPPEQSMERFGTRTDVSELLSQAAVFVLSSRFEGMPLSIIEAMRAGLPVVASNVGGIPEMITDGVEGHLFRAGDAMDLRSKLVQLLANPQHRSKMGAAARQSFETSFSLLRMLQSTKTVYAKVAAT